MKKVSLVPNSRLYDLKKTVLPEKRLKRWMEYFNLKSNQKLTRQQGNTEQN